MAYEPQNWWSGLIPVGLLWIVATATSAGPVEADLTQRGTAALGVALLDKPALAVAGRDVSIAGAAFTDKGANDAIDAVLGVNGVRLVNDAGITPLAEAKPYAWSAAKDGKKISLSGSTPDPAARASLLAAAKAAGGDPVADAMTYGRGAAAANTALAGAFALSELAQFSSGSASISDGALTLSGKAADSAAYEKAMAILSKLPDGLKLAKADISPPVASPYVFHAASDGVALTLSGAAPSAAVRDAIAAQAKTLFPSAKIVNALSVASGAPAGDFAAAAAFGLAEIATLDKGALELIDAKLSISGAAKAPGAVEAFAAAAAKLPAGFTLAKADITPMPAHPYVFAAERNAEAIHLTGSAPDLAAKIALEKAAAAVAPSAKIVDDLVIASGAPAGVDFTAAASFAIGQLKSLVSGVASLNDAALSVTGQAASAANGAAIKSGLAALPAGLKLALDDVKTPAPPPPPPPPPPSPMPTPAAEAAAPGQTAEPIKAEDCQSQLASLMSGPHIEFESGKAKISAASADVLKTFASVATRCQVGEIEISGHTDSEGPDGVNIALSRARAEAVTVELVSRGVPADRLKAVGYGSAKPVASNDTEEGRAKNRRIEFNVTR